MYRRPGPENGVRIVKGRASSNGQRKIGLSPTRPNEAALTESNAQRVVMLQPTVLEGTKVLKNLRLEEPKKISISKLKGVG